MSVTIQWTAEEGEPLRATFDGETWSSEDSRVEEYLTDRFGFDSLEVARWGGYSPDPLMIPALAAADFLGAEIVESDEGPELLPDVVY